MAVGDDPLIKDSASAALSLFDPFFFLSSASICLYSGMTSASVMPNSRGSRGGGIRFFFFIVVTGVAGLATGRGESNDCAIGTIDAGGSTAGVAAAAGGAGVTTATGDAGVATGGAGVTTATGDAGVATATGGAGGAAGGGGVGGAVSGAVVGDVGGAATTGATEVPWEDGIGLG